MYSFTYFAEWATPKKWAEKWAEKWADINSLPTHLSARKHVKVHGLRAARSVSPSDGFRAENIFPFEHEYPYCSMYSSGTGKTCMRRERKHR